MMTTNKARQSQRVPLIPSEPNLLSNGNDRESFIIEKDVESSKTVYNSTTEPSLLSSFEGKSPVLFFLRFTGVVWKRSGDSCVVRFIQYIWSSFIFLMIVAEIIMGCLFFNITPDFNTKMVVFFLSTAVILMVQAGVLLPSLIQMRKRLQKPTSTNELFAMNSELWKCHIAFWVCFAMGALYPIALFVSSNSIYFVLAAVAFLAQLAISCMLTASLLFILTDCKVSTMLLDNLSLMHENGTLTLEHCADDVADQSIFPASCSDKS